VCVDFQADVETDEVYAQMTLQPLTPVWWLSLTCLHYVFWTSLYIFGELKFSFLIMDVGRAEGYISSNGIGHSK